MGIFIYFLYLCDTNRTCGCICILILLLQENSALLDQHSLNQKNPLVFVFVLIISIPYILADDNNATPSEKLDLTQFHRYLYLVFGF